MSNVTKSRIKSNDSVKIADQKTEDVDISASETESIDDTNEPKKFNNTGKRVKAVIFAKERQEIVKKLFKILEVTNKNMSFDVTLLDNDLEKQKKIMDMKPEILNYFNRGAGTYKGHGSEKKQYLSMIKSVLKQMNYKLENIYLINASNKNIKNKIIRIIPPK